MHAYHAFRARAAESLPSRFKKGMFTSAYETRDASPPSM